jgi:hypothetical protein
MDNNSEESKDVFIEKSEGLCPEATSIRRKPQKGAFAFLGFLTYDIEPLGAVAG